MYALSAFIFRISMTFYNKHNLLFWKPPFALVSMTNVWKSWKGELVCGVLGQVGQAHYENNLCARLAETQKK